MVGHSNPSGPRIATQINGIEGQKYKKRMKHQVPLFPLTVASKFTRATGKNLHQFYN